MTAHTILKGLLVNYPKLVTVKLLNSQAQAWEMMLSQHAMDQPITGLRNYVIPKCNAAKTPYIRACSSSER